MAEPGVLVGGDLDAAENRGRVAGGLIAACDEVDGDGGGIAGSDAAELFDERPAASVLLSLVLTLTIMLAMCALRRPHLPLSIQDTILLKNPCISVWAWPCAWSGTGGWADGANGVGRG